MSGLCEETAAKLLVVEGKNDCHGIYQLSNKSGLEGSFGIFAAGSDRLALRKFGGMLTASENKAIVLGLVLDCDMNEEGVIEAPRRRWAQFTGRLQELGYDLPSEPDPTGTVIEGAAGNPRVGIWLMPDNTSEGMFEDFLLPTLPQVNLAFLEKTITGAVAAGLTTFKPHHRSKALAHTHLAWQDEPGYPLGIAIKANLFDTSAEPAKLFTAWLKRLFIENL